MVFHRLMIISSSIELLLIVSFCFDIVLCQVHYIVPKDSESCFSDPCLTLSQFAESPTNYADSNITLFIVGGNHDLDREISLSNKEQIFILSINDSTTDSIIICSTNNARFILTFSSQVHIHGIEFVDCDGNIIRMVGLAYIILSGFTNSSRTALTIIDSHVDVQSTSFSSNIGKSRNELQIFRYVQMIFGMVNANGLGPISAGGALIMTNSTLLCELCQFNGNSANIGGAIFMESGSNATIRNSVFTSNHALDCHNKYTLCLGGAVNADATLDTNIIIHNCSFQNNTSYHYGGGVVVITTGSHVSYDVHNATSRRDVSLSIVASSFINNNATVGGAIYLYNSNVAIFNCTFQYSEARMTGGIIAANASSFVTLNRSYLTFNEAEYGGVLSVHQYSTVHVEGCHLEHNTARIGGGVVFAKLNSRAIFQSCEFANNSAKGGEGGVALLMNSSAIINNGFFSDNSATSGGVLYAQMFSCIVIQSSLFDGNNVDRDGAVAFLFGRSKITVIECAFNENRAVMEGGAIKVRNWSLVSITNSNFSHNSASVYGGALHIKDHSVGVIYNSQFDGNIAIDGGAINAYLFCTIEIYSSTFSNNKANITGGVISSKLGSTSSIADSGFHNNTALDIGAVIYTEDQTNVSLDRSFFTNNSATYGGAVAIRRRSAVKVNNCQGGSNTARVDGGFLYTRTNSKSVISNSSFTKNIAKNNGIVVASDSSNTTIDTSIFTNNTVGHDGAVVFVHDRGSAVINSCNFIGNWANNSGGVVYTRRHCSLTINNGYFYNNTAENSGGVVCTQGDSKVSIEDSNFTVNKADYGGVVRMYIRSNISISGCHFSNNEAKIGGGIVATYKYSMVTVQSSKFILNTASYGGVVIAYQGSTVIFDNVSCLHNSARSGGVIRTIQGSNITVNNSCFSYNIAEIGGVLNTQHGVVVVKSSRFEHNSGKLNGGAMYTDDSSTARIYAAMFWNSTAESDGGAIGILDSAVEIFDSKFTNNRANGYGGVINVQNSSINISDAVFEQSISGRSGGVICSKNSSINISACSFTNNNSSRKGGALTVYWNSTLMVLNSTFMHNAASDSGGALYLAATSKSIIDDTKFYYNRAEECGGAVFSTTQTAINITKSVVSLNTAKEGAGLTASLNSSISFDKSLTDTQICENNATLNGGGILLTDSILYFTMNTTICHNMASTFGGGLFAFNSDIVFGSSVVFDSNRAMHGGGASLAISKLISHIKIDEKMQIYAKFIMNRANIGGALYVDNAADNTTCSTSGCFFQNVTKHLQLYFKDNFAERRGPNLFGGLLDRCTAISNPASAELKTSGIARFQEISNVKQNLSTVSSKPVRVCLCENNVLNCSLQTHNVSVKQGNPFTIQLSAVDQVLQSVSATIQSELKEVSLPKNQTIRRIDSQCSNLDYQAFFPSVSEIYNLIIYASGPCDGIGISNLTVNINVFKCSCGPGFMREDLSTKCSCVCDKQDKVFSTYIKECSSSIESIIRKGVFWITYLNNSESDDNSSSPYFIYPYCPLGYCQSPSKSVPVNLGQPNGSDAQCAHNRSGLLCGRCKPKFSLSLGSSKCIGCPRNWQVLLAAIIIAAFFAGILLVLIILMLNLTVAVGTVNSIIFYANIIYANRSIFFNHWQLQLTFASVLVSWLNLDIGFDVCFYKGMDIYVKTWLQLAFSLYLLLLVIMIIWISAYSSRLSNLLGRRNPVATLATLILLSYTKLLEAIINSFSFVTLNYPNGTTTVNWLPDANMVYSDWKLILLICSASIILIFGLLYTVLIFSWQWLVRYSRSTLFKWAGNQKLHLFIDSYHIPHTTKHRYWTGLLLFVRVIIYLISAFSASINPRISLLSTVVIICCLFLYKTALMIRVYKNWLLYAMESFTFFNIVVFVTFTWYTFDDPSNANKEHLQTTIASISVGAMLFLFLLVILFHVYRYGNTRVYALFQNTKFVRKLRHHVLLAHADSTSSHESHYRLFDYIDNPRSDNDDADDSAYSIPFVPTRTTISLTDRDESSINESHTS